MVTMMTKKLSHNYLLAALCALITFIPVLNYALTVPSELVLVLGAWLISNLVISAFLLLHSRLDRSSVTARA